jgi:hypothetical protein
MGFRISWLAARQPLASVVSALKAEPTGRQGECFDFPFSVGEFPDEWSVVWSEDEEYFNPQFSTDLSYHFPLIVCHVNETVMHSSARYFDAGEENWSVWHEGDEVVNHIDFEGNPPVEYSSILAEALEQRAHDNEVDYVFEVPLKLAENLCGFKHDEFLEDIQFHEILLNSVAADARSQGSNFVARLFGR